MGLKKDIKLLADVSHEIRNPLNAIIGIAHLLQDEPSESEQRELLKTLLFSSENLLELTNNILDFSKLESGHLNFHRTAIDLRTTIERSLFGQKAIARSKHLDFRIEIDERIPQVVVLDKVKFTQVLFNLVSNALKFTETGSVTLSLEFVESTATTVTFITSVSDTGIGIPRERMKAICEPFRQADGNTNEKYGGTGLGLTITSKMLLAVGSRLEIESVVGKGSRFSFRHTLKVPLDQQPEPSSESISCPNDLLANLHILLVDDNKINLMITGKYLSRWNIAYQTATNGLEALEKIQQEDFDMVLMDLNMPVMDGFQTAEVIKTLPGDKIKNLRLIAFSGSDKEVNMKKLRNTCFSAFLQKPFKPQELLDVMLNYQG